MKMPLIRYPLIAIAIMSLPGLAYSACFPSITLGQTTLGEWSNLDRSWVISATVGDYNSRASSKSELLTERNRLQALCETEGKRLISEGEKHFTAWKEGAADRFDASCTQEPICSEIRDITVQAEKDSIDDEIGRLRAWYQGNIQKCKSHFTGVYNMVAGLLCH